MQHTGDTLRISRQWVGLCNLFFSIWWDSLIKSSLTRLTIPSSDCETSLMNCLSWASGLSEVSMPSMQIFPWSRKLCCFFIFIYWGVLLRVLDLSVTLTKYFVYCLIDIPETEKVTFSIFTWILLAILTMPIISVDFPLPLRPQMASFCLAGMVRLSPPDHSSLSSHQLQKNMLPQSLKF